MKVSLKGGFIVRFYVFPMILLFFFIISLRFHSINIIRFVLRALTNPCQNFLAIFKMCIKKKKQKRIDDFFLKMEK